MQNHEILNNFCRTLAKTMQCEVIFANVLQILDGFVAFWHKADKCVGLVAERLRGVAKRIATPRICNISDNLCSPLEFAAFGYCVCVGERDFPDGLFYVGNTDFVFNHMLPYAASCDIPLQNYAYGNIVF